MTQEVICIIASLRATKKTCNGAPLSFSLPIVTPSTTLNMTRPSTFVPSDHSDPISHVDGGGTARGKERWKKPVNDLIPPVVAVD